MLADYPATKIDAMGFTSLQSSTASLRTLLKTELFINLLQTGQTQKYAKLVENSTVPGSRVGIANGPSDKYRHKVPSQLASRSSDGNDGRQAVC